jgi:hypothetical protein
LSTARHELRYAKKITVETIREFDTQPTGKEQIMDKAPKSLVGEMSVMDSSGHKQLKWNIDRSDEVATAKKTFDSLIAKGYSAFGSKKKEEPKHLVRNFDPEMEEVVMVPRTVGG